MSVEELHLFGSSSQVIEDPVAVHIKTEAIETVETSCWDPGLQENVKLEPVSPESDKNSNNVHNFVSDDLLLKNEELEIKDESNDTMVFDDICDKNFSVNKTNDRSNCSAKRFPILNSALTKRQRNISVSVVDGGRYHRSSVVNRFYCRICDERFPNVVNMYSHVCVVTNHNISKTFNLYLCKLCDNFFNDQSSLKKHLMWHASFSGCKTGESCFKLFSLRRKNIQRCLMKFNQIDHYNRHLRCNMCDKFVVVSLEAAVSLDVQNIGRTDRLYHWQKCYICNVNIKCSNIDCIRGHSVLNVNSTMKAVCKYCDRWHKIKSHMKLHVDKLKFYCHF